MPKITVVFLFIMISLTSFGQVSFQDELKAAQWKALEDFNDSTFFLKEKLTLVKFNPSEDSLKYNPTIWVEDTKFCLKYYYDVKTIKKDSTTKVVGASLFFFNGKYTFDANKNHLTVIFYDKENATVMYKTEIISGNQIVLTKLKSDTVHSKKKHSK